ncbi:peptidylprolyl isomerase [Fundicoccus culcitae]|uniref:Foldase protein PrsA n=1 Tax=Fundicoccus culcitae TaxID=2969821 RepID=A0ABY5P5U5_9LACT|nr:peptidylprolyl isomerase [Fundicoccus culcitae]UUX33946.1 peptidylprolyl isomerase [Fundicoccus culcitae]
MKKSLKKMAVIAASLVAIGGVVYSSTATAQNEGVIATVGEQEISQEEFYQELKAVAGDVTLRTMILEMVLEHSVPDAQALRTSAEEEVSAQIDEAGGQEVFDQLLAYQQLGTTEDFTEQIYLRNLFQAVIEQNTDMSDAAIQNFYDNEYAPTMEAQHILVETEEEALAVIERINNGEEFDAVAQEVSLDSSASNGGLLSPFTTGQMVPEFEEAVVSQENGEMTQVPVQSSYGYHVIRTINNGTKAPLDEIRDDVELQYINSKLEDSAYAFGIIGRLVQDANVQINDEDLATAIDDLLAMAAPTEEEAATEESAATEETVEADAESTTEESAE